MSSPVSSICDHVPPLPPVDFITTPIMLAIIVVIVTFCAVPSAPNESTAFTEKVMSVCELNAGAVNVTTSPDAMPVVLLRCIEASR